ncbi:MAG: hypothetical protein AAF184_16260 [Pseudomonadota bacterium]
MTKSKLLKTIEAIQAHKWPSPQKRAVITALALGEEGTSAHLSELLGIPLRTLHVLWSSLRADGWVEWDGEQYTVSDEVKATVATWQTLAKAS